MNLFNRDSDAEPQRAVGVQDRPAVVMTARVQQLHRPPLDNVAAWMRSLRYEDMMQMAAEVHGIQAGDQIETPEQMAKLLHAWAKATTERDLGQ